MKILRGFIFLLVSTSLFFNVAIAGLLKINLDLHGYKKTSTEEKNVKKLDVIFDYDIEIIEDSSEQEEDSFGSLLLDFKIGSTIEKCGFVLKSNKSFKLRNTSLFTSRKLPFFILFENFRL